MKPILAKLAVGIAVLVVAGCGSASNSASELGTPASGSSVLPSTPGPSTSGQVDYGQQYLAITRPGAAATAKAFNSIKPSDTAKQVAKKFEPTFDLIRQTDAALLRASWPENVRRDIEDLVSAQNALIAAIEDTSASSGNYVSGFNQALAKVSDLAHTVHADLGIPDNGSPSQDTEA